MVGKLVVESLCSGRRNLELTSFSHNPLSSIVSSHLTCCLWHPTILVQFLVAKGGGGAQSHIWIFCQRTDRRVVLLRWVLANGEIAEEVLDQVGDPFRSLVFDLGGLNDRQRVDLVLELVQLLAHSVGLKFELGRHRWGAYLCWGLICLSHQYVWLVEHLDSPQQNWVTSTLSATPLAFLDVVIHNLNEVLHMTTIGEVTREI